MKKHFTAECAELAEVFSASFAVSAVNFFFSQSNPWLKRIN
jgi:hypothetical protein